MQKFFFSILSVALPVLVWGDLVHVYEETETDGVKVRISERSLTTGMPWETQAAPTKAGYIFTHWSISTAQEFVARDAWGRALDVATFKLYEDTTLTAHYMPTTQDSDGDGVADGYEFYWYGNLVQNGAADTDGDGFTFAEELANGTNPLMPDADVEGPVRYGDGELLQYNPHGYPSYVFRSEPEGALFATKRDIVAAGTYLTSADLGAYGATSTNFAYWTVNGEVQRDAWGRAVDVIAFNMPTNAMEVVAVVEADETRRQKLYWYGTVDVAMDSDTDGDGSTFAEELASGTNPLMPDADVEGPVRFADGELLQYNPWNAHPYTFRSDPEGALFPTTNDYMRTGGWLTSEFVGSYGATSSKFAYWVVNGVAQRDTWGRALDIAAFPMPTNAVEIVAVVETDETRRRQLYWYGTTDVAMDSDTDGDGLTFAEELANGTNPLMPDDSVEGPIRYADGELLEANLQPFEQVVGTLVDGGYQELFTSNWRGNDGTSVSFDGAVTPTIVDLDGDGRFDLVVETDTGTIQVFLNGGTAGNPQFAATAWQEGWREKLVAAKAGSLDDFALDTPAVNPTGWTMADVDRDGVADLLVGDAEGRIWFYKGVQDGEAVRYVLQNKVWGGSFEGFANGLTISAVDWDEDGDVDLVCGTADGKLMLLTDPRIGRPVNVQAEAGATSVVLTWDANVNSRVRGYGIYRGVDSNNFTRIARMCPLPRYRDEPEVLRDYWYRVTGMSRFYTTGNSSPIESESEPTDAVAVKFAPRVWLNDTSSFTDTNVEMVVSVNNSMGLTSTGLSMTFMYEDSVLEPIEVVPCGVTEGVKFASTPGLTGSAGRLAWSVSATGGEIKTGAGLFFKLKFRVKPVNGVASTTVILTAATLRTGAGRTVVPPLPQRGVITLAERAYPPALVTVAVADKVVDSESEFELPVTVTSTEALTSLSADVVFDEVMLEVRGVSGAARLETAPYRVVSDGGDFVLRFFAKDPQSVATNLATTVTLKSVQATDCHGHEVTAADASGRVFVRNMHPIVAARVAVATEDRKVDTLETVTVPFRVTSSEALTRGRFVVEWDEEVLSCTSGPEASSPLTVEANGDFSLQFLAKDQHDVTKTLVRVTAAEVTDVHGFVVHPAVPVASTVLIHDAHPLVPAKVSMTLADVSAKTETEFDMVLAITTTEALTDLRMDLAYDTSLLTLKSGVLNYSGNVPSSVTLRFYAKENHTVGSTKVTVTPAGGTDHNGLAAELPTEVSGTVILADSNPWVPATVSVSTEDRKVDTLETVTIPFRVTSSEALTRGRFVVEWDEEVLSCTSGPEASSPLTVEANGDFSLQFLAKDQHDVTKTLVRVTAAEVTDVHGFVVHPPVPVVSTILIHDAYPLIPAQVAVQAGDVNAKTLSLVTIPVTITTTKILKNLSFRVDYDSDLLEYRGCTGATWTDGLLSVSGEVPSKILLTFYAKDQHTATATEVILGAAQATCTDGLAAEVGVTNGRIMLTDSNPPIPPSMSVGAWSVRVKSGEDFLLPIGRTSDSEVREVTVCVDWDSELVSFRGCDTASALVSTAANARRLTFTTSGLYSTNYLSFSAATIPNLQTSSWVRVTAASGVGANGLDAKILNVLPVKSTILITREIGRYSPGDINGDGKLTDADKEMLENFIKYQSIVSAAPQLASQYASWKLTGSALKAADVNSDGRVDVSDRSLLKQWIAEYKEMAK